MQKNLFILGVIATVLLFNFKLLDDAAADTLTENNLFCVPSQQSGLSGFSDRYKPEFQENAAYDFRKVRWGMSPDEVEASMGKPQIRSLSHRL